MCNISKKTDKETVTVYKVVERKLSEGGCEYYLAYFSGVKVALGNVKSQTDNDKGYYRYEPESSHYNETMVGKSSGFARLETALNFLEDSLTNCCVLKIVLGGEIWEGDASHIAIEIDFKEKIYAETEILSFEKVR